jgi:purine-binding chemotaxis protein CheW
MSHESLLFQVDDGLYGLPISQVREVLLAVTPAGAPQGATALEGVINLRGRVVPMLSARRLFGLPQRAMRPADHLIVIEQADDWVALHVDRALALETVEVAGGVSGAGEGSTVEGFCRTSHGLAQMLSSTMLVQVCRLQTGRALVAAAHSGGDG